MQTNKAYHTWERAEGIIKKIYPLTKEIKLFPLTLKILLQAWEYQLQNRLKEKKDKTKITKENMNTLLKKYKVKASLAKCYKEMQTFQENKEKSPLEFQRKEKYVICSDKYQITILNEEKILEYLQQTKEFLNT